MYESQRDEGFRGGIQKGTNATDALAKEMDNHCKILRDELAMLFPNLKMKKRLNKKDIPYGRGACAPDGGLWFKDGKLVVAFEAKKQGKGGNAIDRWYKNNYICHKINPEVSYVTFAAGPGANGIILDTLYIAHEGVINKFVKNGNSCFISENGFTLENMRYIMREVLESV
jgi:hypothetical protein